MSGLVCTARYISKPIFDLYKSILAWVAFPSKGTINSLALVAISVSTKWQFSIPKRLRTLSI